MKEREYRLKTLFGTEIGIVKICVKEGHTWDWSYIEQKMRESIHSSTGFTLEPKNTKTEEIQYLGQQLCASDEKDVTRINSIAKRLEELATVKLKGKKQ